MQYDDLFNVFGDNPDIGFYTVANKTYLIWFDLCPPWNVFMYNDASKRLFNSLCSVSGWLARCVAERTELCIESCRLSVCPELWPA